MHSRGFTLVELLVVMTISAILIAVAVPSFQWTIARNRISDATNLMLANLEYARMEATRRGNTVSMCRTANPNVAAPVCSPAISGTVDGNDWALGFIVFEKIPPNGNAAAVEAGDQIIFIHQLAQPTNARVMIHSDSGGSVAYPPRGAGPITGSGTFAITYGTVPAPAVATRGFGSIPLTGAGRCIFTTLIGSMSVIRPGAGTCPAP